MRSNKISATSVLLTVALLITQGATAQHNKKVLFIGNSYTEVNNLPAIVQSIADNMGDTLRYSSNTPGGCTFNQHCSNASMTYINQGGWDAVVLQEQSQYPSFPQEQVEAEVFPYAQRLVEAVYAASPCAEPMFYMTWGRRDGDAGNAPYFPVLATYEGMDSMLYERYTYMARTFDASVCPVGRVWRSLRTNHPDISLYASDGSHPSAEGSYAAACAFYVMLFGGNPASITYDYTLSAATAAIIRQTVASVVYDSLARWQRVKPQADFSATASDGFLEVVCTNNSTNADSFVWDFGDGSEPLSTADSIIRHQYSVGDSAYSITLIASRHCMSDTMTQVFHITSSGIVASAAVSSVTIAPNPSQGIVTITSDQPIRSIKVYDAQGRMVASSAKGPESNLIQGLAHCQCINLTGARQAHGIYNIQVQTAAAVVVRRVVVL